MEKTAAKSSANVREYKLFINGEFVDAAAGGTFETINPGNGEIISRIADIVLWSACVDQGCSVPTLLAPRCRP